MKNWFKFGWFGSKEREEVLAATPVQSVDALAETEGLIDEINLELAKQLSKKLEGIKKDQEEAAKRPFSKIVHSNGVTTVIFPNGVVISKEDKDGALLGIAQNSTDRKAIEALFLPPAIAQIQTEKTKRSETTEEREIVKAGYPVLARHKDFEVSGNLVFLKGVRLPLPAVVIASFVEILEKSAALHTVGGQNTAELQGDEAEQYAEQFEALKMFWLKLALNPIDSSREDLLAFVKHNDVRITPNGNLVLYRRVYATGEANKAMTTFISQEYYRIKGKKKGPSNYMVVRVDGKLQLNKEGEGLADGTEIIGDLKELYKGLDSIADNTFTSAHNRGKYTIKIGSVYKIDDTEINLDNTVCHGGGLHAAAVDYNYSGYGDTGVVVLVNPSKATTVPLGEISKLRTTEMFVACINDKPIGTHFDSEALTAFDEEYHEQTLEELEAVVSGKSFESISVLDEVPQVSLVDVKNIRDMLKSRIKTI